MRFYPTKVFPFLQFFFFFCNKDDINSEELLHLLLHPRFILYIFVPSQYVTFRYEDNFCKANKGKLICYIIYSNFQSFLKMVSLTKYCFIWKSMIYVWTCCYLKCISFLQITIPLLRWHMHDWYCLFNFWLRILP